jgi:hypothetical protein
MGTMNIDVITSFNQKYFDIIGNRCVSTWLKHWPRDMILTCYVENMRIPNLTRTRQIEFDQLGSHYRDFQAAPVKGRVHTFAKKAFSVIHAMHHSSADRIVWLDADVLTLRAVDRVLLEHIMPDDVVSTHMGVTYSADGRGRPGSWLVPETGVFVLNTRHERFCAFRDEYTRRYQDQDFVGLRRSYDNDVYGAVITKLDIPSLDLCADLKKPYKTPLKHTVLGEYLHHYKAKHSKDHFAATADQ